MHSSMHLCGMIKKPLLLAISMFVHALLFAQDNKQAGNKYAGYYNGSRHELAQELVLLPDHRFIYSSSYGASDELLRGKWEVHNDTLLMLEEIIERQPFVVYGRYNDTITQGRLFAFNNYSQNLEIVFGFDSGTAVDSFRRLFSPEQYTFSHSEKLRVTSRPVQVFSLAMPSVKALSSSLYDIYDFSPGTMNDLQLFYVAPQVKDAAPIRAVVKSDTLWFVTAEEDLKPFGARQPLSSPLGEYDEVFSKRDLLVPDSIQLSGELYHLMPAGTYRSAAVKISNAVPHFHREEEGTDATTAPVADPVAPATGPR